jgi:hypothetical protein
LSSAPRSSPQGPSFSLGNNFRFIAAEFATPAFKPRAISIVVLCAVPAAVRRADAPTLRTTFLDCLPPRARGSALVPPRPPQPHPHRAPRRPPKAVGPEFARLALLALPQLGGFVVLAAIYAALLGLMAAIDWRSLARLEALADAAPAPAAAKAGGAPAAGAAGKDPKAGSGKENGGGGGVDVVVDAGAGTAAGGAAAANEAAGSSGGGGAAAAPLLSYRKLLLHSDFVCPALICGGSFMAMAAIMSMTPVRMVSIYGDGALSTSTWVVEAHIVAMYLPGENFSLRGKFFASPGVNFARAHGDPWRRAARGARGARRARPWLCPWPHPGPPAPPPPPLSLTGLLSADLIRAIGAPLASAAGCAMLLAGCAAPRHAPLFPARTTALPSLLRGHLLANHAEALFSSTHVLLSLTNSPTPPQDRPVLWRGAPRHLFRRHGGHPFPLNRPPSPLPRPPPHPPRTALYYGGDHPGIFFGGMVAIGLGWHFAYVGASTCVIGEWAPGVRCF